MKRIAIIFRQHPFCSNQVQETIDIGLAYAAFDQLVSFIFLDDAVLACCADSRPDAAGYPDFLKQFKAFSLYEIEQTLVCSDSLAQRGLADHPLRDDVITHSAEQIARLIANFDIVISI